MSTLQEISSEIPASAPSTGFEKEATAAALTVRKALADLVAALNVRRPRELENNLGLDYKLSWCVFQVIAAPNVLGASQHIPKKGSIKRIVDAANKKGISANLLNALRKASTDFEEVVRIHAADRVTFDSIVAGVSPTDGEGQIDLMERRTAFRANSHVLGRQADTHFQTLIVRGNPDGDTVDQVGITGRLGLKRFRIGAKEITYRVGAFAENDTASSKLEPLDPEAHRQYGASLLPAFSTQPLPQFERVPTDKYVYHLLGGKAVGLRSAFDLVFGSIMRNYEIERSPEGQRMIETTFSFRTPSANLLMDLIIHRPTLGTGTSPGTPKFDNFALSDTEGVPPELRDLERLPMRAEIIRVDGGISAAQTPLVPRYVDLLHFACDKLNWNPEEFDIYRVSLEFPIVYSTARFQFLF